MKTITTEQNENSKDFKNVLINNECIGVVLADDSMSPIECYEALKNNWAIDEMEGVSDQQIDRNSTY